MNTLYLQIKNLQHIFLVTGLLFCSLSYSQEKKNIYFETEYMIGRVVPNYIANFPNTHLQHVVALNIGSFKTDTNSTWSEYFNFPQTGISIFYSNIGNNKIFGHEVSLLSYISVNIFNKSVKPYYLKVGLGIAYFTTHYDSISNPRNVDIGSSYTWSFQAGIYKTLMEKENMNLKLGLVFSHASNGHTQLPNYGVNSALFSLSSQFYNKNLKEYQLINNKNPRKSNSYNIGVSYGLGFHEYGDKDGPVGGEKGSVQSTSLFTTKTFNNHLRWGLGGTYRFYETYKNQIISNNLSEYENSLIKSSSNIAFFSNIELLMGHVGLDAELGFNLYKPFYKKYEEDFPPDMQIESYSKFTAHLSRFISTRLGLNLYMFNTNKLPKHNFYIGPHIKANSGSADFTEIAFGYTYRLGD